MYRSIHSKVTSSRFSVVYIDGCPLDTVYFIHHNARLPLTFYRRSSGFWLSVIKILILRRITGFPNDRTVSILTVDTAAVNNLISFCEGQHFYFKRFENIEFYTLDRVADTNHTRPLIKWN